MRIVVGLRSLFPGRVGGLETYVRELLRAWGETHRDDEWIVLVNPESAGHFHSPGPWMRFETVAATHDLAAWKAAAERHAPAIYFSPMLVIDPPDVALPTVVNIPDLQHLAYPEFFDAETLAFRHLHFPLSVRRAAAVVTLSAHARQSIIDKLGARPERVHDILLAAGDQFRRPPEPDAARKFRERYSLPEVFGYFPANFWPHKNHATLFAALALLHKRNGQAPHVALSGFAGGNLDAVRDAIRAAGLEGRIHILGYLDRDEIPTAYQAASFLVFPSLFEGFGIPVAEAMASGCPVIASNATSIPELAGDAALLFEPRSADQLADRINTLLTESSLRRELIEKGLRRSRELTWARAAEQTYAVFRGVADGLAVTRRPPVLAIRFDSAGRIDPETLPAASPAPILHFTFPGDRLAPDAVARVRRAFNGTGLGAVIGAVAPAGGGAEGHGPIQREPFTTMRLKSEDYIPLGRLWVGPEASPGMLAWFSHFPGTPLAYEILLRAVNSGAVGEDPELLTLVQARDPAPAPIAPVIGARLSHRYFGCPDGTWLRRRAEEILERRAWLATWMPARNGREFVLRRIEDWLVFRQTGRLPPALSESLRTFLRRTPELPPSADGWIGSRAKLVVARPADNILRLRLEAPEWPDARPPWITIRIGRVSFYRGRIGQPGIYEFNWPWPGSTDRITLSVHSSATFVPVEHNISADGRRLSVRVLPD